ncbi:MAG TPA: DUF4982 domain-containing protein [Clostridia bacterium]|nr:DUF4982 domain-containing protein [Clostridia bacterium]
MISGTESFPIEAYENWEAVKKYPHVIGDFVWTAWDYLGESGIGHTSYEGEARGLKKFPWHVANCGDLDICGRKRPQSHYRDFLWNDRNKPYIGVWHPKDWGKEEKISPWGWPDVLESWSFPGYDGSKVKVVVYAAGDQVELYLNGELLDKKSCGAKTRYIQEFEIQYIPGKLEAVAYADGLEVSRASLCTVGRPQKIIFRSENHRDNEDNMAFIEVEIADEHNRLVPYAEDEIEINVRGGKLLAMGSGDPKAVQDYTEAIGSAWRGRAMLVVQRDDDSELVEIRAMGKGLDDGVMTISYR